LGTSGTSGTSGTCPHILFGKCNTPDFAKQHSPVAPDLILAENKKPLGGQPRGHLFFRCLSISQSFDKDRRMYFTLTHLLHNTFTMRHVRCLVGLNVLLILILHAWEPPSRPSSNTCHRQEQERYSRAGTSRQTVAMAP
jgi:hypothetical protein